jgi:hypothetical protein
MGLILSFLVFVSSSNPTFARMYKWYDRDGVIHVSDKFPDQAREKGGVFRLEEIDLSEPTNSIAVAGIIVSSARAYWSDGRVAIIGEVQNNTSAQVGDIRLQVVGYDLSNKLFNMNWAFLEPTTLGIGKSGIFKTYFEDSHQAITRIEIRLTDKGGEVKGTPITVYVTEPQTKPVRSAGSPIPYEVPYAPVQEVPVSTAPTTLIPAPSYSYGSPIVYPDNLPSSYGINPVILGYNPYYVGLPNTIIYNKNVLICNQCTVPSRHPRRFDPPVRFAPRPLPEPQKVIAREHRRSPLVEWAEVNR